MKRIITLILILVSCFAFSYNYETISTQTVCDGAKLLTVQEKSVPWNIWVIEIDLTKKNLKVMPAHANDLMGRNFYHDGGSTSREKISSLVTRKTNSGKNVYAAINADFFALNIGVPNSFEMIDGRIVTTTGVEPKHSGLLIDKSGVPYIDMLKDSIVINVEGKSSYKVDSYNLMRWDNFMVVFNSYIGTSTHSNQWGTEVLLNPYDTTDDGIIRYKVSKIEKEVGNMAFSSNQIVLSGDGVAKTYLDNTLKLNDIVSIYRSFKGFESVDVKQVVGGMPQIVRSGVDCSASQSTIEQVESGLISRNPRTGVGYNQNKDKMYFFVVDGRTSVSLGMTLAEFADLMKSFGVYDGLNFDGGGSTEMYVNGKVKNNLSDGSERAISNALLLVENSPITSILNTNNSENFKVNITSEKISVSSDEDVDFISIYDIQGRKLKEVSNQKEISLSGINVGFYIYQIRSKGSVKSDTFIINKY